MKSHKSELSADYSFAEVQNYFYIDIQFANYLFKIK